MYSTCPETEGASPADPRPSDRFVLQWLALTQRRRNLDLMPVPHPGTSELGWLADLKETAEQVGALVYGESIRWDVEGLMTGSRRRPDVVIRRDRDSSVLASGEAKRPDVPEGVHPLVGGAVRDAVGKAQHLSAPRCFTTNFFEIAVFDAGIGSFASDLDRLQGNLIALIPPSTASAPDWWNTLPTAERSRLTLLGLRQLFERLRASDRQHIARNINEITLHVFTRTTERLLGSLFEAFTAQREAGALPGSVFSHALQVQLNPAEDAEARYLVAQGIAEVLTATLFYRNISDHFGLGEILGGTTPSTSGALRARVGGSFRAAIARSGDYETIFGLSPAAEWVLSHGGGPVLQQWRNLFDFVEQLDFTIVSSDVIGSIFERLISPERRHAMGQHYTDARIAQSMSRWAVTSPTDAVADVACGAGTFLVEVYKVLASLGGTHSELLTQVLGNDLDPFAVHLATVNLATRDIYRGANYPAVRLGDAFDIDPASPVVEVVPSVGDPVTVPWPTDGVDAVVGNPPYAMSARDPGRLIAKLGRLGMRVPTSMAGNLAAWFGLLAAALIRPDGRWALVMPTAVLQNTNLVPWRRWLRANFDVVVWHTEDDVWFSDARVATCVVLAKASSGTGSLHFVDIRERVRGDLAEIAGVPSPSTTCSVRDLSSLGHDADVLIAGTYPEVLDRFTRAAKVRTLDDLSDIEVFSGNKLGHAMYQLRDNSPNRSGVLRDLQGYEMEVRLNRSFLLPFFRSPMDERTGEFASSEYWVLAAPESLPSTGSLRNYVRHCEQLGVQNRPSVRQRGRSWWSVDWRSSQVAIQIHPGFLHQVWWSAEPFVAKNNFHVLDFSGSVAQPSRELVAASLASGFGALGALFLSSEVGNEGVRWLSTEQLVQWPVLDPTSVSRSDRDLILRAYRLFRRLQAEEIHQMSPETLTAWHGLTAALARAAGLATPDAVAREVIELARQTCVRRADREAMALAGRMRSGVRSGTFVRHVQAKMEAATRTPEIIERLTSGEQLLRLRPIAYIVQGTLDFGEDLADGVPGEESLSAVLGEGFECAPTLDPDDPDALANEIARLLDDLSLDLIGPPPLGFEAAVTYQEIAEAVRRAAIDWLQRRVHDRLG